MNTIEDFYFHGAADRATFYLYRNNNSALFTSIFRLPMVERIIYSYALQGISHLLNGITGIPNNTITYRYSKAIKRLDIYISLESCGWRSCIKYIKALPLKQEYRDVLLSFFYSQNINAVYKSLGIKDRCQTAYLLKMAINEMITLSSGKRGALDYNMQKWFKSVLKSRRQFTPFGDISGSQRLQRFFTYSSDINKSIDDIIQGNF